MDRGSFLVEGPVDCQHDISHDVFFVLPASLGVRDKHELSLVKVEPGYGFGNLSLGLLMLRAGAPALASSLDRGPLCWPLGG